jgi:subtilisin family serine protease
MVWHGEMEGRTAPAAALFEQAEVRRDLLRYGLRQRNGKGVPYKTLLDRLVAIEHQSIVNTLKSVAVAQPSPNRERRLEDSLNHAAQRAALVVAAAGNQGTVGGSAITRHPWVIPVAACDAQGRPLGMTNLGGAIGRRGLMAPGDAITSLDSDGGTTTSGGTSAATPFVTGAIALVWSIFRRSSAATIKTAVTRAVARRNAVVPPVLDAAAAYQFMAAHG